MQHEDHFFLSFHEDEQRNIHEEKQRTTQKRASMNPLDKLSRTKKNWKLLNCYQALFLHKHNKRTVTNKTGRKRRLVEGKVNIGLQSPSYPVLLALFPQQKRKPEESLLSMQFKDETIRQLKVVYSCKFPDNEEDKDFLIILHLPLDHPSYFIWHEESNMII